MLTDSASEGAVEAVDADPATSTPPVVDPAAGRDHGSARVLRMGVAPAAPAVPAVETAVTRSPRILGLAPLAPRRGAVVTLDLAADRFGPGGYAGRGAPRHACPETAETETAETETAETGGSEPLVGRGRAVPPVVPGPSARPRRLAQHTDPVEDVLAVQVPVVRSGGEHAARPGTAPAGRQVGAQDAAAAGIRPGPEPEGRAPAPTDGADDASLLSLDATRAPSTARPAGASSTRQRLEPARSDPARVRVGRAASDRVRTREARGPRRNRPVLYGALVLVLGLLVSAAGLAAFWSLVFVLG